MPRKLIARSHTEAYDLWAREFDDPALMANRDAETTRRMLDEIGAEYHYFEQEDDVVSRIVDAIEGQKVVGHMAGRMEFGPRALGSRSIIGDARSTEMQSVMNLKIKFRESFRPFAPCVLRDHVDEYFEMRPNEAR